MNRKKWFSLITAIMTALMLPFSGMASEENVFEELQGYVTLIVEGGFIMDDIHMGQVLCNVDETTVIEGDAIQDGVKEGDYVLVTYDGRLTRSIPPQAHADRIVSYKLEGVVLENMGDNMLAIEVPEQGEVWVYAENVDGNVLPGMHVTVYYDGIMALSFPARVSARELVIPELNGSVGEMTENGFMLTLEDGTQVEIAADATTRYSKLSVAEGAEESENTENAESAETDAEAAPVMEEETLYAGVEESVEAPAADAEATGENASDEEAAPAEEKAEEPVQPEETAATEAEAVTEETADAPETSADEEAAQPEETAAVEGEETADETVTEESEAAQAEEPAAEEAAQPETTAAPAVSAKDFLKEGDKVTVYYGGKLGGEGPLHALKIVILP